MNPQGGHLGALPSGLVLGSTLCGERCGRYATLTVDPGERWQRHICFECVEAMFERENALMISRDAVELLDRATKNVRYRPLPPPRIDLATADYTKLNALKAQWRAHVQGTLQVARCWAILPDGGRCVRAELEQGLCDTHLERGARLPGLGWRDDTPLGVILERQGRRRIEVDHGVRIGEEAVPVTVGGG